jgi:membrane protease YdiL (CAAX protease family)
LSSPESPARSASRTAPPLVGAAILAAYLGALAATELGWSLLGLSATAAAVAYGLLALLPTLLCLALPAAADVRVAALLPPLVAVSVVRLVTVAAEPAQVRPVTRLVVVGLPALAAVALAARQRPRQWRLVRPRSGGWRGQLLVALAGIPAGRLVWGLAPPTVAARTGTSAAVAATVLVVFAALPDELLYRGLLLPAAVGVAGRWALPLSSALYATAYLPGGSTTRVLLAFLLGMGLGWCRYRTGSVVGAVAAHGLLNVVVYVLLPPPGP